MTEVKKLVSNMQDDEGDAANVGKIALTCFPSLTGLRPCVATSSFRTEVYQSESTVSDLQESAGCMNVSLIPIFQAAWVKILSAYTDTKDDITFLSILPRSLDKDNSCPSRLELTSYHPQEEGQGVFSRSLCKISEHISHTTREDGQSQDENDETGFYQQNGTILDLENLYYECPEDFSASGNADGYHGKYATAVIFHLFTSKTGRLTLATAVLDDLVNERAAQLILAQFDCILRPVRSSQSRSIDEFATLPDTNLVSVSNHEPAKLGRIYRLQSHFEHWVNSNPQRIALEFYTCINGRSPKAKTKWTYDELNEKAETVAWDLQGRFDSLADRVVPICMDRCPEIYIAILGILKAGAAWCPIDASFPPRRRHDLIARAGATVLLSNARSPQDGVPDGVAVINITDLELNSKNRPKTPPTAPSNLAYLIWTSGTTGLPKGVPISHQAAVTSMRSLQDCIPTNVKNDIVRCLQFSQFTFDVFVQDLFYTWGVGGTVISADRVTMLGSFAELTTQTRATHAHLTPAFAASVARKTCPTLEVVTMIGERLTQNVADNWSEDCRLYNTYGPAETTVVSTVRHVPHGDTKLSANVGLPLSSVSAFVIRDGEMMMRNGIGELALGGPQLSQGYWKDPARTAERFVWNEHLQTLLYMTGDTVRQLYDGSFEFIGRTDDLIKIQGIRVELSEIAFALRSCHTEVQQVEVLFLDRPDRPSRVIVAFLAAPTMSTSGHHGIIVDELSVEVAQAALLVAKAELPDYMIPKVFLVVGAISRTSSAKVDRAAMRQIYTDTDLGGWEKELGSPGDDASASTDFDSQDMLIVELISEATGTKISAMGRQSTLSSIGVDSITATRLATKLQVIIPNVSVAGIFSCQTLGDLLRSAKEGHKDDDEDKLDLLAFHNETLKYLDTTLAKRVELIMPVLPLQESFLSESLQNAESYWSNNLFALDDRVDLNRLERAWKSCARSIDALRTAFHPVVEASERRDANATFVQLIYETTSIDWAIFSPCENSFEERVKSRARAVAERHQKERFAEPPWAVTIFISESRNVMMFSIHHSIRDEPSVPLIMSDLYHQYLGKSEEVQPQRSQLRDAISLLHTGTGQRERDQKFWATCLPRYDGLEESKSWPELKLANQGHSEGTVAHSWSAALPCKYLQIKAKSIGATSVASLLRVVWGCLLLEYLETDKVVFGETLSSRGEAASLANVVGPLISVIPVPFQAHGTSRQILNDMTDSQGQRQSHSGVHPRTIRRILGRSESPSLYPAVFNFVPDSADQNLDECSELWQKIDDIVGLSVEHALALNAYIENDGALTLELVASRQYLDLPHVRILARQIDAFVNIILHHPDEPVASVVKYMPKDVMSMTASEGFEANRAWIRPLTTQVDCYASLHPEWTAAEVVDSLNEDNFASKIWSYEQLRTAYRNVAVKISGSGCFKQMIAVCLDRRLEVYAVILAIMSTGNTYLPIAEDLPDERKAFLLKDSDAALLFTTRSLATSFSQRNQPCRIVFVEDIDYSKPCQVVKDNTPLPTDNAYLLYTSGSTGAPKGVLVNRGNLMSFIEAISDFINSHVDMASLQGKGKWLGMASFAFDVHLLEMFFAWHHGMTTITAPRSLLLDNLDLALRNLRVTHASFVPSLVDSACLDPGNLPDLRYMSVGGEKITQKIIDTWSRSHVTLANAYGPTEVTVGCCFKKVEPATSVRNIGPPLPYTTAHVLRFGTTEYVLRGTAGELCLTGDLVANGYHKRSDAKGFVEDFNERRMYRTGDRARMLVDGSLEFLGRDDDQTKIRGQRIELGEVSETVRDAVGKVIDVKFVEAASMIVEHPSLARPRLVTFVVVRDNARKIVEESSNVVDSRNSGLVERLREHCSNVLPSYMIPDHIIRLASLPLVAVSRKIDNKRLKAIFSEMSVADLMSQNKPSSSSPRALTEVEEVVKGVATQVLVVDRTKIQADINLFRLGLDSLNAISLTINLQKFGFECTVSNILKTPTIESLARLPRMTGSESRKADQPSYSDLKRRFFADGKNGHDFSDVAAVRPCLPLQETLVASSLNSEGRALYVNHVVLRLSPMVDHQRLIQAWKGTAEDQEILKTCFHEFKGHFVQIITENSRLTCEQFGPSLEDDGLSYLRQGTHNNASDILAKITSKPPLRLTLIPLRSERPESLLLVSIHHGLYDAESFSMILDEVYARYQGTSPPLVRTPLTALLEFIGSQSQQDAMAFWQAYLVEYKPSLFPLMSLEDETKTTRKVLSTPLSQVERLAASLDSTPASVIKALFGVVLAEMFNTNDIVFGSILSGRTLPVENADTILAPCITTIPQRVQIMSESGLEGIIKSAQKGFIDSLEYQHTALRDIYRWVMAERPLFDTLFSYTRKPKAASWSHLWHEVESFMPSEFPLAVEIVADQEFDRITARCDFDAAFGTADRANALLSKIERLLQALLAGGDVTLTQSSTMNGDIEIHDSKVPCEGDWTNDEKLMKDIIAGVVNLAPDDIERDTSFFALGLDSIIAIQFVRQLKERGLRCSSAEVMRYPSISELVNHISSKQHPDPDFDRTGSHFQALELDLGIWDTYPCTPLQSSMLTQTLGSDGSLYVHHHAMRLSAEVKLSTMKKAWENLVAETEILRTSFHFSKKSRLWLGKVHMDSYMAWDEHDPDMELEHLMQEIKARFIFQEESDFSKPPWRVNIIGQVCMLTLHHSLYDGESLKLLLRDFAALVRKTRIVLRPPFSHAARAVHAPNTEAENFWARKLDDFKGIAATSNHGHFHAARTTLKSGLHPMLESCKRLGVTLQSVALLALGKTLAWLSGRLDIVFGHIVRGRSLPSLEAEDVVGPLFNAVPHRVNLHKIATSNRNVAKGIQDLSGESQTYQHSSLSKVQQAWREDISNPDAELLDTLFVFQKQISSAEDLPWASADVNDDVAPTEYATNFEFIQKDTQILICMNSRRIQDLDGFLQMFERILSEIVENPDNAATAFLGNFTHSSNSMLDPEELVQPMSQRKPETSDATLESVRGLLAEISGISIANIADDASIFSLGLDSLSAIQVAAMGRKKGFSLSVADVLQGRTVWGISQRFCKDKANGTVISDDTKPLPKQSSNRSNSTLLWPVGTNSPGPEVLALAGLRDDDVEEILPCLPGQSYHLAMWLKSDRRMGEATFTYASKEQLDLDRLLNSWRRLRGHHSILRTIFAATPKSQAAQIVVKSGAVRSDAFQCIHSSATGRDEVSQIIKQEAFRHFDLFSPPVELLLVQSKDGDHVVLKMHHALYDAWTIKAIIQDLGTLYEGKELASAPRSSTLIRDILQFSDTEASQKYWRKSFHGFQPTNVRTSVPAAQKASKTFFFMKRAIPDLRQLENKCQQSDNSLPTAILIAFADILAHFTSVSSPIFGLFQTGRSSSPEDLNGPSVPCLNVTPLMIRDVSTRDAKDLTEVVLSDLAARVPFEQAYLHDILKWIGVRQEPLFNSYVNILWGADAMTQADGKADELLSPHRFGNIEDIVPRQGIPGKTAIDGLDMSMLADGNLFLDVQKCAAEDSMRVSMRCDRGALNEEEAEKFLKRFVDVVGKSID